jgi:hypothetical protein
MTVPNICRREPGRDPFGHYWDNAGEAIFLPEDQASQLLAEPAQSRGLLPMYSLIEPGATREVATAGDPVEADEADAPDEVDKPSGKSRVVGSSDSKSK